ncbi:MAG: response regulator transcription factor, partial [Sphingobacteriaceae bacterium]
MINLLLAEDHNLVRNGIKSLLDKQSNLKVVAEAINGKQVLDLLTHKVKADIILADLNMPEMNGIDMVLAVKDKFPLIKVVVLSMLDHEKYIMEAFKAGASAYILKNVTADELVFAIKHVYNNNERYICSELSLRMLDKLLHRPETAVIIDSVDSELSKREIEVLFLVADGFTN